jgi:hypothetical protein
LFSLLVLLLRKQQELQQNNHHVDQDDCKLSAAPKHGYSPKHGNSYSKDDDDGHYHCLDKSDTVFATFSAPKAKKKHTQK